MIVIVAGMQRSGSTFSCNVARELLDARGGVSTCASDSLMEALSISNNTRHAIVKTHAPEDLINSLLKKDRFPCICTVRKPEDAIASWMHVFGFSLEESVITFRQWLLWHQSMHPYLLNLRFEEIDRLPFLTILRISWFLLHEWRFTETVRIWSRYRKRLIHSQTKHMQRNNKLTTDIGFSYYDKQTFFHRRHISSLKSCPAADRLPKKQVQFIRDELRDFLDKNGNYNW